VETFIFLKVSRDGLGLFFWVLLGCFWDALGVTLATLGGLGRIPGAPFYENSWTLVARRENLVRASLCGALCQL
jgi:hypothetical protein